LIEVGNNISAGAAMNNARVGTISIKSGTPHRRKLPSNGVERYPALNKVTEVGNFQAYALIARESKLIASVAAQLMNGPEVILDGERIPVTWVGSGRLRSVRFNPQQESNYGD
jgi:hypothetical protein